MNNNFFCIEGKQLDAEQIESAKYVGNELVIAGAGAGKTLSIVGKVKYLTQVENVKPSEILVLAFTDKVVNELKERVGKVCNDIEILTFHKLGLKIFRLSEDYREISENAFYFFLRDYFYNGKYEMNHEFASAVYKFVSPEEEELDDISESMIKELTNCINKVTRNGEKVSSLSALITCNMLRWYDIKYKYYIENKYSHYLRFDDHIINFTSYTTTENLSLKGVKYDNVPDEVFNYLKRQGYKVVNYYKHTFYLDNPGLVKVFDTFFESLVDAQRIASAAGIYDADFDYLEDNICEENDTETKEFLEILRFLRIEFCKYLKNGKKVDLDSMIHGPIEILKTNKFLSYKYIIVDEYQDISPARYNLLVELQRQNNGYIMAYGDDWQSIYSFSGSNNKFFMEFGSKIPDSREFYLKNTYRNSKQLIDASAKFVMQNPCQKEKNINSNKSLDKPIVVLRYEHSNMDNLLYTLEYIKKTEKNKTVQLLVLGRTNYAINSIIEVEEIYFDREDEEGREFYKYEGYPNIDIQFLTIHRSKGLEADYVFVTRVNEYDIPLQVEKNKKYVAVLNKFNEYSEEKEHEKYDSLLSSEERRLFYVALTRTKNIVFLSTPTEDIMKWSPFVKELINNSKDQIRVIEVSETYVVDEDQACPKCGALLSTATKKMKTYRFCENKCKVYS